MSQVVKDIYKAPASDIVQESDKEFQKIALLKPSGRMGRIQYLHYAFAIPGIIFFSLIFLFVLYSYVTRQSPTTYSALLVGFSIIGLFLIWVLAGVWLAIQRCHDANVTGWLSIFVIIPVLNIVFLLISGTKRSNRFGQLPTPNTRVNYIFAAIGILIYILLMSLFLFYLYFLIVAPRIFR